MIGIETIRISRMADMLRDERFRTDMFTVAEQKYCDGKARPEQSYAGIYCAKKAAAKAASGVYNECDFEIAHDSAGAPVLLRSGAIVNAASVSVSHDGDYAIAAVLFGNGTLTANTHTQGES